MMMKMTTFKIFFLIRIFMACISVGSFVPDETWQSVEVAHNMVFGQGYLTWEWKEGIRSYLHPCLYAILFYVMKWTTIDSSDLIILLPRILQAVISAIGDTCMVNVFEKIFWKENKSIFIAVYATNWFVLYASSRTLINTFEMALTNISLKFYVERNSLYVSLIALSFMARPTTAIFWIPLVLFDILYRESVIKVFTKMIPQAMIAVLSVILLDSWFYGQVTIAAWTFLKMNLLQNISEQYGVQPWHWYISNFMPALFCGFGLYPLFQGVYKGFHYQNGLSKILLFCLAFSMTCYSFLGHKEHRFIMPLIPLMMAYMALGLKKITKYLIAFCMLNIVLSLYLSLLHQRGPQLVMKTLSSKTNVKGILILTPCHGTPYYSHLHRNISMRFLECPPNLGESEYQEEDKIFFQNPKKWLEENEISQYDHIIFYEGLRKQIEDYLQQQNFRECEKFWHTNFPDDRTSSHILIYCK